MPVYFIQQGQDGPIKIGYTCHIAGRFRCLQSANPDEIFLLLQLPGTQVEEGALHERFKHLRVRGEWYRPELELLALIGDPPDNLAAFLGVQERSLVERMEARDRSVAYPQMAYLSFGHTPECRGTTRKAVNQSRDDLLIELDIRRRDQNRFRAGPQVFRYARWESTGGHSEVFDAETMERP